MAPMSRRSNGAGTVFIKHGNYYGRWYTPAGGRANRKLGPVRRPGTASGLTRAQAEKRLREMMSARDLTTRPNAVQLALHRGGGFHGLLAIATLRFGRPAGSRRNRCSD